MSYGKTRPTAELSASAWEDPKFNVRKANRKYRRAQRRVKKLKNKKIFTPYDDGGGPSLPPEDGRG